MNDFYKIIKITLIKIWGQIIITHSGMLSDITRDKMMFGPYEYIPEKFLLVNNKSKDENCLDTLPNNRDDSIEPLLEKSSDDGAVIDSTALNGGGLILTRNCNLRCSYCSESSREGQNNDLTIADIDCFIGEIIKRVAIKNLITDKEDDLVFTLTGGGEPTYDWDMFERTIETIRSKEKLNAIKIHISLTTNGILNDYQRNYIVNNIDSIMVSYDGMSEIQDKNRIMATGIGSSKVVEESISYFVKNGCQTTIRSTMWFSDFNRMIEIFNNMCDKFDMKMIKWSILPVIPTGRAKRKMDTEDMGNYDFFKYYIELIDYTNAKSDVYIIDCPLFPKKIAKIYCGALSVHCQSLWLMPEKTITTCIELGKNAPVVANVDNNCIKYTAYHDKLLQKYKEKYSVCKDCVAFEICKGGCPARHIVADQLLNDAIKTWECEMIQEYWNYVLLQLSSGNACLGWDAEQVIVNGSCNANILKIIRGDNK